MAALDTPWVSSMSSSSQPASSGPSQLNVDRNPPTFAAFSPATLGHYPSSSRNRATILVHQKSPLLVATPPQITRALAYSHPFLLPLNKLAGLLTWTTGDPWESFLLVAVFWGTALYGDIVLRWAGPIVVVLGLILGMYGRRYSPLSSTGWTGEKGQKGHKRAMSEGSTRHHKSLEEIVETLKLFTSRCSILLDPLLRLTDFLSTQRTATSATTRPALTALFIRILLVTPVWILLTLPPLYIITTKRIILTLGTLVLTWHSRPARVSRTILWRSKMVRKISTAITGLHLEERASGTANVTASKPESKKTTEQIAASLAAKRRPADSPSIRFTFTLFENQRRWLGIGWTSSMLAYERAAWTDEHLNPAPPKDQFELPKVKGGHAKWRWVKDSEWQVEGAADAEGTDEKGPANRDTGGWIYCDNKWRDGRRGQDGWGRYTRRRKWYRDAELVEITPSTETTPSATPKPETVGDGTLSEAETETPSEPPREYSSPSTNLDSDGGSSKVRKRGWFRRNSKPSSEKSAATDSSGSVDLDARKEDEDEDEDDVHVSLKHRDSENNWGLGDDARMELG